MSLDATIWAWKTQGVSSSEKLILLSLADRANEKHVCWPTVWRLERDTCLHRQTVMAGIKKLAERKLIEVIKNGRRNKYRLLGVKSRHDQPENADRSVNTDENLSEKPDRDRSEKPDTNPPPTFKKPSTSCEGARLVSNSAFMKARSAWPDYDIEYCYAQWELWSKEKCKKDGAVIRNHDAAFLTWMKTDAKDNPPPLESPPAIPSIPQSQIFDCQQAAQNIAPCIAHLLAEVAVWMVSSNQVVFVTSSDDVATQLSSWFKDQATLFANIFGAMRIKLVCHPRVFPFLVTEGRTLLPTEYQEGVIGMLMETSDD